MEKSIKKAVEYALKKVGLENFKKTSLFLSNEMKKKIDMSE
jgi:hypothetical protein